MSKTKYCGLCKLDEETHKKFERNGKVHHVFSEAGKLKRVKEQKGQATPAPVISGDPALRLLLIEKGIITDDDLARVNEALRTQGYYIVDKRETAGRGRNSDDRDREGSERGMRDSTESDGRVAEDSGAAESVADANV